MPLQKTCSNPLPKSGYPLQVPRRDYGSIIGIGSCPSTPDRIKSPPSLKRASPNSFKTLEFFTGENTFFQKSYLEIAKAQGIQKLTAKQRIKTDIKNGNIEKERTTYKSPKYKTLLDGRNKYHLTEKGRKIIGYPGSIPLSSSNSSKEEYIAKSTTPESDFQSKAFQKAMLQKYGLTHLVGRAPSWWFKDQNLPKTLKLLSQKKSKGYKARCDLKWITSTLKQEGVGYREKVALETSKKLNGELAVETPFEKDVLSALKSLQSKGLDTSHNSLKLFLRNGLSKLRSAISVLEKYLQWNKPIKSLKGMLSWIIGQKDPMELLKPIAYSPEKQINKLKHFLTHNASHFTFSKPTTKSPSEKPHIEFFIHKKALLSSVIKLYKKIGNEWRCMTLEMGKTTGNFFDVVTKALKNHFGGQYVFGN